MTIVRTLPDGTYPWHYRRWRGRLPSGRAPGSAVLRGRGMLFETISGNLAQQNWTKALIEFVIVVLGVFVGIQVSNWNDGRIELRRAHGYLQRIQTDLEANEKAIQRRVEYWTQVVGFGESAMAYAETRQLVGNSRWRTVVSFYQASQVLPFRLVDSTYQEMVNTGDLGLLNDDRLRSSLADYYVSGPLASTPYLLQYVPDYRILVRGATPERLSSYIWMKCLRNVGGTDEELSSDCPAPITETEAQAVLDAYLATPGLLPSLRFWITNQKVSVQLLRRASDQSPAMLREVKAALAR